MTDRKPKHVFVLDHFRVGTGDSWIRVESRVGVWPNGWWWFEISSRHDSAEYRFKGGFESCEAARAAAWALIEDPNEEGDA